MTLTELTPEIQKASEITGIIFAWILVAIMVIGTILAFISTEKTARLRQEYMKTLNDHDKSVIAQYYETKHHYFKKHEKQTTENTTSKQN